MMRLVVASLLCAFALPLAAQETAGQEMEQLLLPVEPSVMFCSHEARFDTRLVVYNPKSHPVSLTCAEDRCGGEVKSLAGRQIEGASSAAMPTFLYLPKSEADDIRMSLVVESSVRDKGEGHSFTEVPIARASDFREDKLTLVGVRMDPGYRQAIRLFGLDGGFSAVMVRVYDLITNEMIYEEPHVLWPLTTERTAGGMPMRPAFTVECDLAQEIPDKLNGQYVRIELESLTPGLKFWSFVSVTNNDTQQFYTISPRR